MPNITNREAAEALIRQQIIDSIVQDAPKSSIVMQLGPPAAEYDQQSDPDACIGYLANRLLGGRRYRI